jgi:hypothetical protein
MAAAQPSDLVATRPAENPAQTQAARNRDIVNRVADDSLTTLASLLTGGWLQGATQAASEYEEGRATLDKLRAELIKSGRGRPQFETEVRQLLTDGYIHEKGKPQTKRAKTQATRNKDAVFRVADDSLVNLARRYGLGAAASDYASGRSDIGTLREAIVQKGGADPDFEQEVDYLLSFGEIREKNPQTTKKMASPGPKAVIMDRLKNANRVTELNSIRNLLLNYCDCGDIGMRNMTNAAGELLVGWCAGESAKNEGPISTSLAKLSNLKKVKMCYRGIVPYRYFGGKLRADLIYQMTDPYAKPFVDKAEANAILDAYRDKNYPQYELVTMYPGLLDFTRVTHFSPNEELTKEAILDGSAEPVPFIVRAVKNVETDGDPVFRTLLHSKDLLYAVARRAVALGLNTDEAIAHARDLINLTYPLDEYNANDYYDDPRQQNKDLKDCLAFGDTGAHWERNNGSKRERLVRHFRDNPRLNRNQFTCKEPRPWLQTYQKLVVEMFRPYTDFNKNLVVYRTGSGKSRVMMDCVDNFYDEASVLVILPNDTVKAQFYTDMLGHDEYRLTKYALPILRERYQAEKGGWNGVSALVKWAVLKLKNAQDREKLDMANRVFADLPSIKRNVDAMCKKHHAPEPHKPNGSIMVCSFNWFRRAVDGIRLGNSIYGMENFQKGDRLDLSEAVVIVDEAHKFIHEFPDVDLSTGQYRLMMTATPLQQGEKVVEGLATYAKRMGCEEPDDPTTYMVYYNGTKSTFKNDTVVFVKAKPAEGVFLDRARQPRTDKKPHQNDRTFISDWAWWWEALYHKLGRIVDDYHLVDDDESQELYESYEPWKPTPINMDVSDILKRDLARYYPKLSMLKSILEDRVAKRRALVACNESNALEVLLHFVGRTLNLTYVYIAPGNKKGESRSNVFQGDDSDVLTDLFNTQEKHQRYCQLYILNAGLKENEPAEGVNVRGVDFTVIMPVFRTAEEYMQVIGRVNRMCYGGTDKTTYVLHNPDQQVEIDSIQRDFKELRRRDRELAAMSMYQFEREEPGFKWE